MRTLLFGQRRGHARIGSDEDHRRAAAVALAAYEMHSNPPARRTWWRGLKRFALIITLVVATVIALLSAVVIGLVVWAGSPDGANLLLEWIMAWSVIARSVGI